MKTISSIVTGHCQKGLLYFLTKRCHQSPGAGKSFITAALLYYTSILHRFQVISKVVLTSSGVASWCTCPLLDSATLWIVYAYKLPNYNCVHNIRLYHSTHKLEAPYYFTARSLI